MSEVHPLPKRDNSRESDKHGTTRDPLFDRGAQFLEVDPERDQLTSHFNNLAFSVNADVFIEEGISLSGTHLGLNLISKSGVVLVAKDAKILPSKTRPSRLAVQKFVNAGEVVLDRLQSDTLAVLADGSKTILGDAAWGVSFVTTENAEWRVQRSLRKLTPREKRVDDLFSEATLAAAPEDNGYDSVCRIQDAEIEAQLDATDSRPRLAAINSAQSAGA